MLKDLTQKEIDRAKELDRQATPGPWINDHYAKKFGTGYTFGPIGEMIADQCPDCKGIRLRGVGGGLPQEQNGDFIAESRDLLPRAISHLERLQKQRDEAFEILRKIRMTLWVAGKDGACDSIDSFLRSHKNG